MREDNRKNLSVEDKTHIAQDLLQASNNAKQLSKGSIQATAQKFGVSRRLFSSIWSATKSMFSANQAIIFKRTQWSRHKDQKQFDIQKFKDTPLSMRTTYRRIATEMKVSKSTVGVWFKKGKFRVHTNQIKQTLCDTNKIFRMKYSLSSIVYERAHNIFKFKSMHNTVHMDEKWFYLTKQCERYYLHGDEPEPQRKCQNKKFITKLMFMCLVARPLFSNTGEVLFDGKIGIFPFTKQVPAQRNSKNRVRGTLETKSIDTINKEVIKECMINQIIPAIKEKWPDGVSRDIFIQQDNARPHIVDSDIDFRVTASSDGFNIHLVCQPANSPDTHINDLGWFRAIQSLQTETPAYTVEGLIENVMKSYDTLTPTTLNCVYLSLQNVMIEILKCKGDNLFKLPHMGKARLMREGRLPDNLQVDEDLIKESITYLVQPEKQLASPYDEEVNRLVRSVL